MKKIFIALGSIFIGIGIGCIIVFYTPFHKFLMHRQVIGFLPYWNIGKTQNDYSPYITTLTYFSVTIDGKGNIVHNAKPTEREPGWNALQSTSVQQYLQKAREKGLTLSLAAASGDQDAIDTLMEHPIPHARNFTQQVIPLMRKYGFTDLNLDIEQASGASDAARTHFIQFVTEVKKGLHQYNAGTLTVETLASDVIKKNLIDPKRLASIADYIVIMTYDYHYQGSYITGSVAPLRGTNTVAEYDVTTALNELMKQVPAEKIILGAPLYGYSWETLTDTPRAGVISASGLTISNRSAENFLALCATCSAQFDQTAQEAYVIYKDTQTGTYHQMFYPDNKAMQAKVSFATKNYLGGIALWALGYEGKTILEPLKGYIGRLQGIAPTY